MKMKFWVAINLLLFPFLTFAQGGKDVIQFSGLVVGGDSLYGIPGVYVFVPKAGRGTSTNETGFFSLPTLTGDSVSISAIGFKNKIIVVPKSDKQSITVIVELQEDTAFYPIVEIFPYPTEELFKQAFLALKLSDNDKYNNLYANLSPNLLHRMIINSAMSGSENQKYSLRNQIYPGSSINYVQGFQLLNPFAWSRLVKSIRKGDSKKKPEED